MYKYATFRLGASEEANHANQELASSGELYGVEVTIPALAKLCALGNLDPQHTGGQTNQAACTAALTCELPPDGAILVTVRPDADSIAAMAVLLLRSEGHTTETIVSSGLLDEIATGDCAPDGPWVQDYTPPSGFAAANSIAMDFRKGLDARVNVIANALIGAVLLATPTPNDYSQITVTTAANGQIAVALADGPAGKGACGAGYRYAPVVVTLNEQFTLNPREVAPHRKYTVARWNATHVPMDWDGMLEELQAVEPGWGGGGASICGSTQNQASPMGLEQVIEIVARHLT